VLPLLIFIGAIGTLAWVTQYLPSRQEPDQGGSAPPPPSKLILKFANPYRVANWEPEQTRAQWEKLKEQAKREGKPIDEVPPPPPSPYAAEYEVTTDTHIDGGHYDFEFENANNAPVLVGVESKTCQCASVVACALNSAEWARYQSLKAKADPVTRSRQDAKDGLPWKALTEGSEDGLSVSAGQHGVIRIFWEGRNRLEPEKVRLNATIWVSPPGKFRERQTTTLGVHVSYVRPAHFYPDRLNLGTVSPQGSVSDSLHCMSATRDLEVSVSGSTDPCFEVQVRKLEKPEDLRQLAEDMRAKGILTRVRSAYRIDVTVHERKDGKQFDLGTFLRPLALAVKGNGERLHTAMPAVRGRIQGEIKVGTFEDDGAINLKNVKEDRLTRVTGKLWAKAGMELDYDSFTPKGLNLEVDPPVKLPANSPDSVSGWTTWEIRMTVPAGLQAGPLPEDSAIFLRVKNSQPPRRIRIPLIGSVGRG
jgi:hypothetical protein